MALKKRNPVLDELIQRMDLSREFKAMARANGYKTLRDILDRPLNELPTKKLSGYRLLKEFLDIMIENDLQDLIEGY